MLIADLQDTWYPRQGYSSIRRSVRVLVFKQDRCAMLHIKCHDGFGQRDHYEIPGGGIEPGESEINAVHREIMEELGMKITSIVKIGTLIDRWNLLKRINVHHYYRCEFVSQHDNQRTEYENDVFVGVEWHSIEAWLSMLSKPNKGINAMIHGRERIVLEELKKSKML